MPNHPCGTAAGIGLPANMSAKIIPTEADVRAAARASRYVTGAMKKAATISAMAEAIATERARVITAAVEACNEIARQQFEAMVRLDSEGDAKQGPLAERQGSGANLCAAAIRGLEKP